MTIAPGSRLGPYEITAKLGAGGMGEVYRATDRRLGREVAVKVLPEHLASDRGRLQRLEREARLLAQLNHPNIAILHALEQLDGQHALVMELVEGEGLDERIARGPIPVDEALPIALQIAVALEAAHEKGIVHRDLKPANVRIRPDGAVKVLDFGLAKAWEPPDAGLDPATSPTITVPPTEAGTIIGTVAYMSPEQARGSAVDKRADIWALGVVVYEMLCGRRPFLGATRSDTLAAVLTSAVEWAALPAGAPAALHRLLHRCLERDSRRRLRDVGEARVALEDSIAGRPDEPAIARAAPSMARRGGGWRLVGLAVGLGIVAGIGGAALTGWFRRPAVAEAIHVRALTYSGADSEPAASPDGKLIAFTSWRDGVARIWLKQLAGGGEAPLTSGPDGHARFSPDGASLLFVRDLGATQAVYRTSLVGGEPRRLVNDATAADWSPDGRHIVFVRNGIDPAHASTIGIFDLESGAEQIRARLGDVLAYSPRWSPDGRQIAFASGSWSADDWKLDELDVATGLLRAVPPGALHPPMSGIAWSGRGNALFFVQSSSLLGDLAGFGSRIIRCEPRSGERRTVLWSDGIAWTTATADEISATDVLAPGRLLFSQRLKRQSLREVDLRPAGGASSARVLAEGSSIDRQPTYSPDGREILFSSNRGGNLDLWTLDRASGALRRVTDDPAQDWDPAYAADGRHVIWSSDRASGHLEIWMANADGSGARQVTHDGVSAQNPESTPGGRWIVYWSGNPAKLGIWKIHPDGSDATRLLPGSRIQTEVSPDGRYVLYEQQDRLNLRNTIHFLELKSGRVLPVAIEVRYTVGAPAIIWGRARWSADGKAIYFVGEDERGLSGVYAQQFSPDRDTSATRRPVAGFSPDYVTESLGLSPDGSRLAISGGLESASIMVADGVPGALPMARTAP